MITKVVKTFFMLARQGLNSVFFLFDVVGPTVVIIVISAVILSRRQKSE